MLQNNSKCDFFSLPFITIYFVPTDSKINGKSSIYCDVDAILVMLLKFVCLDTSKDNTS